MSRIFLKYQGESVELPPGETIIGRDLSCRLRFNDPAVSRRHVRLTVLGEVLRLEDLCSSNGTFLNGSAIESSEVYDLHDGDILKIGGRSLFVQVVESEEAVEPEPKTLRESLPQEIRSAAITTPIESLKPVAPVSEQQQCPKCKGTVTADDDECSHCGYSWSDFRPHTATKVSESPIERRRHRRLDISIPILYASETLEVETVALDLSLSGVFVSTEILDPEDTGCTLTIMIDGGPPVVIQGMVRRVVAKRNAGDDRPPGIGIEFSEVNDLARQWLESTIAKAAA